MADQYEVVRHFTSLEEADEARMALEDEGIQPVILKEAAGEDVDHGVFALEVRESDLERAEEFLDRLTPSEEAEAMETMEDWEVESEEVRERYEET